MATEEQLIARVAEKVAEIEKYLNLFAINFNTHLYHVVGAKPRGELKSKISATIPHPTTGVKRTLHIYVHPAVVDDTEYALTEFEDSELIQRTFEDLCGYIQWIRQF